MRRLSALTAAAALLGSAIAGHAASADPILTPDQVQGVPATQLRDKNSPVMPTLRHRAAEALAAEDQKTNVLAGQTAATWTIGTKDPNRRPAATVSMSVNSKYPAGMFFEPACNAATTPGGC